jgi:hypothetical protein
VDILTKAVISKKDTVRCDVHLQRGGFPNRRQAKRLPRLKLGELQTLTTILAELDEGNTDLADCTKLTKSATRKKNRQLNGNGKRKTCFWRIWKRRTIMEKHENNVTHLESGAGDGNRTRIESLGSS